MINTIKLLLFYYRESKIFHLVGCFLLQSEILYKNKKFDVNCFLITLNQCQFSSIDLFNKKVEKHYKLGAGCPLNGIAHSQPVI